MSKGLDAVYTFLEIYCLYRYVDILYERKNWCPFLKDHSRVLPGTLILCTVAMILFLNSIVLTSPYTVIVLVVQSTAFVCLFWRCSILEGTAIIGGYFLALSVCGSMEITLTGFIGGEELIRKTTDEQGLARIIYMLLFGTNWYVMNTLFASWLKGRKVNTAGMKYIACLSVTGLLGLTFIMVQMLSGFNIRLTVQLFVFLFLLSMGIFTVYYILKIKSLQIQMRLLDEQNGMLERKYQQVNESYLMNARLYHDMNHHLSALAHMLAEGQGEEALKYIGSLQEVPSSITVKRWTGIDMVDVVLAETAREAELKGISLRIESVILPSDMAMERKDLCSLFANLLDNAAEAASEKIELTIKHVHRMLLVRVRNDCRREPVIRNGRLLSTKKEKGNHGLGMQNIEQVVHKYHGSMEYKMEDGYFCVEIMVNDIG